MAREMDWLIAANILFVIGGLVAYATSVGLAILGAIALVAAVAGLWRLKEQPGPFQAAAELAASFAAGAWAVLAVLIILPYITIEDGRSFWGSAPYAAMTVAVASLGMLGWNAAFMFKLGQGQNARTYGLFHLVVVVVAFALVLRGDGTLVEVTLRGMDLQAHDLQLAPALAAAPALSWALGLWKERQQAMQGMRAG